MDGKARALQIAPDAQMIPSERAGSDDSDPGWRQLAQSVRLLSLHSAQTARVQFQQMTDLVIAFRRSTGDESGRSSGRTADTRGNRDEFQKIKSDVLIAART